MDKITVKIMKMGINGEGIGYRQRKPIFIDGALPDEVVEIEITEEKPTYSKAKVVSIVEKSVHRVEGINPWLLKTGASPLLICKYDAQLMYKRQLVLEAFTKYAVDISDLLKEVIASPKQTQYRNQCKMPVKWLKGTLFSGLYEANSQRLVYLEQCIEHEEGLDRIRSKIMKILNKYGLRDYNEKIEKGIRTIVIRGLGYGYQVTLVTGRMMLDSAMIDEIMEIEGITSLYQNVNVSPESYELFSKDFSLLRGAKTIEMKLFDLVFRVSPASFFQLNIEQAKQLYTKVIDLIQPCPLVVEAYSGIGVMSLVVASKVEKVIGIEIEKDAVKNANSNAKLNKISNVEFVADDAARELKRICQQSKVDYLIVDPPRSGLNGDMIDVILKGNIENIIYVSCNAVTLAKNYALLMKKYTIKEMSAFDMFPQTPHVETVVLMSRVNK